MKALKKSLDMQCQISARCGYHVPGQCVMLGLKFMILMTHTVLDRFCQCNIIHSQLRTGA